MPPYLSGTQGGAGSPETENDLEVQTDEQQHGQSEEGHEHGDDVGVVPNVVDTRGAHVTRRTCMPMERQRAKLVGDVNKGSALALQRCICRCVCVCVCVCVSE